MIVFGRPTLLENYPVAAGQKGDQQYQGPVGSYGHHLQGVFPIDRNHPQEFLLGP